MLKNITFEKLLPRHVISNLSYHYKYKKGVLFFFLISCLNVHWPFQPFAFYPTCNGNEELLVTLLFRVPFCLFEEFQTLKSLLQFSWYINQTQLILYFSCRSYYRPLIVLTTFLQTSGFSAVCPNVSDTVMKIRLNILSKNLLVLNTGENLLHAM